jgi:hypothetical protein
VQFSKTSSVLLARIGCVYDIDAPGGHERVSRRFPHAPYGAVVSHPIPTTIPNPKPNAVASSATMPASAINFAVRFTALINNRDHSQPGGNGVRVRFRLGVPAMGPTEGSVLLCEGTDVVAHEEAVRRSIEA